MSPFRISVLLCSLSLSQLEAGQPSTEGPRTALPSIEEKTRGLTRLDGYFDLYWDETTGKLYLEIDHWGREFLYQVSLASGLGSNPIGLDRGQLGGTYVLRAERVGPTVIFIEPNYRYRARSSNADEVRAVAGAFAPSVHWGKDVGLGLHRSSRESTS